MLNWTQSRFSIFVFLDSNKYVSADGKFDCLLAIAGDTIFESDNADYYTELKRFHENHRGWLFGHLQYPNTEKDDSGFSRACFFVPAILINIKNNTLTIESNTEDANLIASEILSFEFENKEVNNQIGRAHV